MTWRNLMNDAVVKVYSEAFFDLSSDKNKLEMHKEDLKYILDVFDKNKELNSLMDNPNVSIEDKKYLISEIFVDIDSDSKNLLNVLIDNKRFMVFGDLVRDFNRKYNYVNNILEGIVYSTRKLDSEDFKNLENALNKKFDKKVELTNIIDESLIGGLSIYVEGKRIDNSIRNRLDSLKAHLLKEGE